MCVVYNTSHNGGFEELCRRLERNLLQRRGAIVHTKPAESSVTTARCHETGNQGQMSGIHRDSVNFEHISDLL